MKLTQLQVSEKNRYQNCLTWSNLQIASVVSDVFGKSDQKIIQSILDNHEKKPNIEQLVHKRMKDKVQDLEIAGKKSSTRISKGGRYLKPSLVQIANAVVKSEKHPEFRNKYLKLKKRRGHRKAIISVYVISNIHQ